MEEDKISLHQEASSEGKSGVISVEGLVTTLNIVIGEKDISAQIEDVHNTGEERGNRYILSAEMNEYNHLILRLGINGSPNTIQIQDPEEITLSKGDNKATYKKRNDGTYRCEFFE